METYTVIDENTVEVGGDRYVFKNKNCAGCKSCGLYPFFFDCIKDKRIKCVQKSLATVGKYGCTSLEGWGVFVKETKSNNVNMEKERKITAPEGCKIEKVELIDGVAVVTFKQKERELPKSWEEFCKMFDVSDKEFYIDDFCNICNALENKICEKRYPKDDQNLLPDRATAEAVLALCQLVQLRNAYNGDWVPDWMNEEEEKYTIEFRSATTIFDKHEISSTSPLYFKSKELREEFLRNFRPLIEKLKPLYGIKEGGEE